MITHEELKKLAQLAKLSLEGEDTDALIADISSVLDFANAIAEAVGDLPEEQGGGEAWSLREDVVKPSFPVDDILSNAGERQDGYYVARKRGGLVE
jgi:aspartyl-tRNA(Asn)/glutamyl-tRNA(Gln) amidotransferase subunit C